MICDQFIHVNMGSCGGGTIRGLFSSSYFGDRIKWTYTGAHMTLRDSWERAGRKDIPSFSFMRNPWDWYLSYWMIQLRYHRWRGSFRDWFYNCRGHGLRYAGLWHGFTDPGVTYVGRFENMEADLCWIFEQVGLIPDVIAHDEYHDAFGRAGWTYSSRPWIEGYEQWLRPYMFTHDMLGKIEQSDGELIRRYGYSFEDHYYHPGGLEHSAHQEVKEITWEQEKHLASWVEWAPGPPGVFVNC